MFCHPCISYQELLTVEYNKMFIPILTTSLSMQNIIASFPEPITWCAQAQTSLTIRSSKKYNSKTFVESKNYLLFCNLKVTYRTFKVTFKTLFMETSIIEQLDKSRYDFLKWATIGWTIWSGTYIATDLVNVPDIVLTWTRILGWSILIISVIRFLKLKRELNWDNKMKDALEGELHKFNLSKSFRNGYFVVIGITILFFGFSLSYTISALIITKVILYFGVLAVLISKIIYNRDWKWRWPN